MVFNRLFVANGSNISDPPDLSALFDVNGGGFINSFIDIFIKLPLIIFPFVIIIGGFMYMMSGSNEQNLKKAQSVLVWGFVGFVISLIAYGIVILLTKMLGANSVDPTKLPAPKF